MTLAEESLLPQTEKKLEKSLDAIAALRRAMTQRLAEIKATQEKPEQPPADAETLASFEQAEKARRELEDAAAAQAEAIRKLIRQQQEEAAARREAEESARREAEAKNEQEQAETARREQEAKAAQEQAEAAHREAEAKAAQEQAEAARREAEAKAVQDQAEAARREAEAKEVLEQADAVRKQIQAMLEQERIEALRREAEAKAAAEALKARNELNEIARREAEARAQAAQEAQARAEKAAATAKAARAAKAAEEQKPQPELHFDIVEWSRIMMHVAEESQKLIRDYVVRTKDKPVDTLSVSPTPFMDSISRLFERFFDDPETYTDVQLATWQNYIDLTRATLMKMQGISTQPVAEAPAGDKRFKAKDWQTNWMFDFLKQAYLSTAEETRRLVQNEATNVEDKIAKKLEFYSRLMLDATAPNNFWMTNPEVLRATLDSKGENLIKGLQNLLGDLERGNGLLRISMSDYRAFEIGKNIASTPGKVVYQNELMQLIQYAPQTQTVRRVPFLIIPPWINKYYILDLKQKNSFVGYLVSQGYTVFTISWVNPTKKHALTQFDDYMSEGSLSALREIKRITGEDEANVLGYCIGGTLLSCTQAYLAAVPEKPFDIPKIKSATYLVTMIDFSQPGDLGVFIDEDQIRLLEDRMARLGYMDASSLIMTFNLLRSNDLIWPFVINNYMLGREPFPFDILYWNTDSTNLPAAMQSYYLRKMYLENKLIEPKALKFKDVPLDLGEIETPSFLLSTREDHIAPWRSTYASTQIYKGPVTFCLSGSGHIAGVINPPDSGKYGYWTNDKLPTDPDEWLKDAQPHKGSWWPEWIKWLDQHAGEPVAARPVEEGIEDAPGSYVKVRVV
ncbi:MAG: class I poly(R)-hydroxyalkanoic acid synthase [Alphaproteobacteria bacterium]|nr:class I poly(R)-hydroxyalkanoic acid synthase [Alphaproteobacteria bacterium]